MNELDLFRSARPDVATLPDATADEIRRAVFGDVDVPRPVRRSVRPMALVAALALAAAAIVAAIIVRGDGQRSIAPATSDGLVTSTTPATPVTDGSAVAPADDWHLHPLLRFRAPAQWITLFEQAREANIGRCMVAAGFEYRGSPYETDSELAVAAENIQAGTYEAAYHGVGGQGGGCMDQAYATITGSANGQIAAEQVRSWADAEWRRTAFSEPEVLAALEALATCAREHGVDVRDVASSPSKALGDAYDGLSEQTNGDHRLAEVQATTPDNQYVHSMEEMQAVAREVQEDWCPTFTAFDDLFAARLLVAAVAWIEANPDTMAGIDAEFAEDMVRFQYIIDHDGELPPS